MSITNLIYKSLTTEISPMVYIMMFVNVIIGIFFFTGLDMGVTESVLYGTGVLVDQVLWGMLLLITSGTALAGMFMKNEKLIQFGGIAGFMLWLFASIALFEAGHIYVFLTVSVLHMLFHGYVYLATTTGVIYRATVRR